jgi:broad specificity phosphatase PhoE
MPPPPPLATVSRKPIAPLSYWQLFVTKGGLRMVVIYGTLLAVFFYRARKDDRRHASVVCKDVTLVRHGQGVHNRDAMFGNYSHSHPRYIDAPLTQLGVAQALDLGKAMAHREFDLVVSSTLSRALETSSLAFAGTAIVATELCRERVAHYTCDQRRPLSALKRDFPQVDFGLVASEEDTMFAQKETHPHPHDSALCSTRADQFVRWLITARPETRIAVVSHSVFLQHLVRQEGNAAHAGAAQEEEEELGFATPQTIQVCR